MRYLLATGALLYIRATARQRPGVRSDALKSMSFRDSATGSTLDFESEDEGSNPSPEAKPI